MGFLNLFHKATKEIQALQPSKLRADPKRLTKTVVSLASHFASRNFQNPQILDEAAQYIKYQWENMGFEVQEQKYLVEKNTFKNLIISYGNLRGPRIVVGAHYDVAGDGPGADDNASGIAGIIELAYLLKVRAPSLSHRIDLVAYSLEEPPIFGTVDMGSSVHARSLRAEDAKVVLMLSLEMLGYYTDRPNSQAFPIQSFRFIYPSTGNFIAVVGDLNSVRLVRKVSRLMRKHSHVDVQSLNAPRSIPGIVLSDHINFLDAEYPAIMITDTAFYRNPHYHERTDVPDTLDYEKMAEVIEGLYGVITEFL